MKRILLPILSFALISSGAQALDLDCHSSQVMDAGYRLELQGKLLKISENTFAGPKELKAQQVNPVFADSKCEEIHYVQKGDPKGHNFKLSVGLKEEAEGTLKMKVRGAFIEKSMAALGCRFENRPVLEALRSECTKKHKR